jgi:hypothetical protein
VSAAGWLRRSARERRTSPWMAQFENIRETLTLKKEEEGARLPPASVQEN